jgi:hypothetical protein
MALEIVRAAFYGALPVAFFTFIILQWSIASGRLNRFKNDENLHRQYKKHSKAARIPKKETETGLEDDKRPLFHKRAAGDLFHNKITFFGGGFYGTMAVLTYALIEAIEIWQFIVGLAAPSTWIDKIGFDLIIDFLVNSITNLVSAFVWFSTLPEYIVINNGFIWLGASYLGYLAGLRLTASKGDWIWESTPGWYGRALQRLQSRSPKDGSDK